MFSLGCFLLGWDLRCLFPSLFCSPRSARLPKHTRHRNLSFFDVPSIDYIISPPFDSKLKHRFNHEFGAAVLEQLFASGSGKNQPIQGKKSGLFLGCTD
jgi:hypothetical protein